MNRYFMKRCQYCFVPALGRIFSNNEDKNIFDRLEEYDPQPKTGFERVQAIFRPTKDGIMPKEFHSVSQLTMGSFLIGIFVGGARGAIDARDNFLMEHRTTKFVTAYEAHRLMFDNTVLSFIGRGVRWGVKVATFTLIYTGSIVLIAAYRGYDGFLEYCVSGAIAGAFVRAYLGYKAAFAGALLGCALSFLVGSLWLVTMSFGTTPDDMRQMQYDLMLRRQKKINEGVKQLIDEQQLKLFEQGHKQADNFGYAPDDADKVFILTDELPKEKPRGIDALPDLPD